MFGMSLTDYLTKHTHKEHQVLVAWLGQQWEKPSRADHYAMQIAQEVRAIGYIKPKWQALKEYLLSFRKSGQKPQVSEADRANATALARARIAARNRSK